MISQGSEGAVPCPDSGHFLHATGEKLHRVRDEVPGEDKEIGPEFDDPVGITPYLLPGHINPGMDIGELDNPQRTAERHGDFPDIVGLARIGCTIRGKQERRCGESGNPGLQKAAAIGIYRRGSFPAD